jgi:hypothetical protein
MQGSVAVVGLGVWRIAGCDQSCPFLLRGKSPDSVTSCIASCTALASLKCSVFSTLSDGCRLLFGILRTRSLNASAAAWLCCQQVSGQQSGGVYTMLCVWVVGGSVVLHTVTPRAHSFATGMPRKAARANLLCRSLCGTCGTPHQPVTAKFADDHHPVGDETVVKRSSTMCAHVALVSHGAAAYMCSAVVTAGSRCCSLSESGWPPWLLGLSLR